MSSVKWGVAARQHQTAGVQRAAKISNVVAGYRRLLPGFYYCFGGLDKETCSRYITLLVERAQASEDLGRSKTGADKIVAARNRIQDKFFPDAQVCS